MSRKHFSWLLALTVAAAVVIGLLPERAGHEATFEVRPLLPGLADRINDVDEIRVERGGEKVVATLHRSTDGWTVGEAGGYPADWPRLRSLLAAFARARVVEPKTANPEYFDRLGLGDIADEDSGAVRIRIGTGEDAAVVLVGDTASNRDGQYVRLEGEERAWLVDRLLDVPRETRDWLDRKIVDIAETEVVEVGIRHPDGERVVLKKASADDPDFVLQDVPEGREVQSSWTLNAPGGGLAGLRLDEVRRAEDVAFEAPVHLTVLTADGLRVEAELAEAEEKHWIRLRAEALEPAAPADGEDEREPAAEEPAGQEAEAEAETETETEKTAAPEAEGGQQSEDDTSKADPSARAAVINDRVGGWVYAIPQYKYDVLTRRLDALLKPTEAEG